MAGEVGWRWKSSVALVTAPQSASILYATEADGRAGVKVIVLLLLLMEVMVRTAPSLLYSS